jgi:hypothetical protein
VCALQQEKLYKNACALLTKQSIDGDALVHATTSLASFIGYHHRHHRRHHAGAAGSAPGSEHVHDGSGGSLEPDDGHQEANDKGKQKDDDDEEEEKQTQPQQDEASDVAQASTEDVQDQVLFEAKLYVLVPRPMLTLRRDATSPLWLTFISLSHSHTHALSWRSVSSP